MFFSFCFCFLNLTFEQVSYNIYLSEPWFFSVALLKPFFVALTLTVFFFIFRPAPLNFRYSPSTSQGIWFFYPPMGTAKAVPERVHGTVFQFYMWLRNKTWVFKNTLLYSTFWKSRKPLFFGWVDGWVDGWIGDQKGPSIFLICKYFKKQNVLIPNMLLKIVFGFYIRSYEHFKFQNLTC